MWVKAFLVVGGIFCLAGCGGDSLPTAPVEANVTLDGKPLAQGVVLFTPEQGKQARGEIQPDGHVVLGTYSDDDGAILGKHQIAVVATEVDESKKPDGRLKPVRWLIPPRYGENRTSGLTFDVQESGHTLQIKLVTEGAGQVVEP